MDTKKILSRILFLLGEALIIAAFILFGGNSAGNILVLNIIATTVIYGLFFIDVLSPLVNLNDKSGRKIGSLGVRWLITCSYAIVATAVIISGNIVYEWTFTLQLIIHGGLIFVLLLGFISAIHAGDKVKEVFVRETDRRNGINEMENAMKNLKNSMNEMSDLPEYFTNHIHTLEENMRFLSPADSHESHELEHSFVRTINDITFAAANFSMNEEAIKKNLNKAERIYENRKQIYSK